MMPLQLLMTHVLDAAFIDAALMVPILTMLLLVKWPLILLISMMGLQLLMKSVADTAFDDAAFVEAGFYDAASDDMALNGAACGDAASDFDDICRSCGFR